MNGTEGWIFDHVGLVVKSLVVGRKSLHRIYPSIVWTQPLVDPVNGVEIQFGKDQAGVVHELLVPLDNDSPVATALREKRNLLNHIAYRVPDIEIAATHMKQARCAPAAPAKPALAYGGRLIQFFITPINTIIELIEAIDHVHLFDYTLETDEL